MTGDLQPVRVAGVVLNSGSPQPGASVELHSWTAAARARDVDRVTTDAAGRFDLGYQDAAMSLILARHEGAEASQRFDLADPATQRSAQQLVLELEPCERFVRGRIVNDSRHPLANIELHLVRDLCGLGRGCAWGRRPQLSSRSRAAASSAISSSARGRL